MKAKRFLALILCICLTACTFTVSAAETAYEANSIPQNVSGLLNAIGITGSDDNVNYDAPVSRGQFAVYAARLAGEQFKGESSKYYTDVPEGSFCYDEVSMLVELGALTVGENRIFNPGNAVTYTEACKILMCVLGYREYSEARGGYPVGYEYAAREVDLHVGLNGSVMDMANTLQMLYNACHAPMADISAIKDSQVSWVQGTQTILSVSRNIHFVEEGLVEKTDSVSLVDDTVLKKDTVQVDGVQLYAGQSDIDTRLGHYVDVYYHKTTDSVPGTVLYLYDATETLVIDIENFNGYSEGVLNYYDEESGKKDSLRIDADVPVLLNGKPVKSGISDEFKATQYGHILVDYYRNEIVMVHIKRMKTIVVKYTDELKKAVWDEYRAEAYFIADEEKMDKLSIYDSASGTKVGFSHIQAGQVLNVYLSSDGRTAEVYASKTYITGSVTSIADDEIFIDGIAYEINEELKPYINITLGMNARFYFDAYEKICALVPVVNENMLSYLYAVGNNTNTFGTEIQIKVFTFSNEHKILTIKLPVVIDGTKRKTVDDFLNALAVSGDMGTYRQLVRINADSNGIVKSIDTAAASKEDREEEGSLVETLKYTGVGTQFYNSSTITPSFYPEPIMFRHTKVVIVPEETIENPKEEQFRLTDKGFFSQNVAFKISAYKLDFTHPFADVIVMRRTKTGRISDASSPIMVDQIYQKLDKDGDVVWAIKGLQSGLPYESECANDPDFYRIDKSLNHTLYTETDISAVTDLSRGDVIRVANDVDGKICEIQIIYDFVKNTPPYWFGNGYYDDKPGELRHVNHQFTATFGHVVDKWVDPNRQWDNITVDRPSPVLYIGYTDTATVDRQVCMASSLIMVYDVNDDRVFQGTWDDVVGYNSGFGGSDVIITYSYFTPKALMVYRY